MPPSLREAPPSSGESPPSIKKEDKSSDVRYGSILDKNRESVFSDEDMNNGNRSRGEQ